MTGRGYGGGHRWVTSEPDIPFPLDVIYEDERIIVVDKPHFLATTPRGMWYSQSALMRLRAAYGDPLITPAHRLDRATAGIVVFVRDRSCRGAYQMLFQNRKVEKVYECLAPEGPTRHVEHGTVRAVNGRDGRRLLLRRSHIVKDRGVLQAYEDDGVPDCETVIGDAGPAPFPGMRRYRLVPRTGKTHQLRVHMCSLGLAIMNDDLYPTIRDRPYDDFTHPLQLVARSLGFVDPVTGMELRFVSRIPLDGASCARPGL
ncbi:pseudouridine synthase [Bifidobacterium minimum]|uniref:RNA pseudouridylate synthase n=1 Tax=Bifidobacterium minimum TaxID=1693 RepID=A0A087BMZ3_9BIFI|nr:pseudouridine synthase [Bifidobacterium minimum]